MRADVRACEHNRARGVVRRQDGERPTPPRARGQGREREGGGAEGVGSRERRTASGSTSGLAGPMHAAVVDTAAALELVLLLRGVQGVLVNHLASALRRLHELHIAACPLACVRERSNTA